MWAAHVCVNWCRLWCLKLLSVMLHERERATQCDLWPLPYPSSSWFSEVENPASGMESVWRRRKVVDCVEVYLLHPHRKCIVLLWWVCHCGMLSMRTSSGRSWTLRRRIYNAVADVSWLLPFQSIEYIKCTLLALAATPLQRTCMIEWAWLGIFYLMDVFHEVYKVICVPPPILLYSLPEHYEREESHRLNVPVTGSIGAQSGVYMLLVGFLRIKCGKSDGSLLWCLMSTVSVHIHLAI